MERMLKVFLLLLVGSMLVGCASEENVVKATQESKIATIIPSEGIEGLKDGTRVKVSDVNKAYFDIMQKVLDKVLEEHEGQEFNTSIGFHKVSNNRDEDVYYVIYDIDTEEGVRYIQNYVNNKGEVVKEASEPLAYSEGFVPPLDEFNGEVTWQQAVQIALDDEGVTMDDVWFVNVKQHSINQMYEVKYGLEYRHMYSIDNQEGKIQVRGNSAPQPDD